MARYVVKDGKIELYQDNKTTTTNNSQSGKWYNNFFKKGDSNPLKATFYTGGDVIGDLLTGALSPIEGVMDLGANVLATGANALGYKEQAQKLRNFADHNSFETMFKDEATETGSVLGDTSDKIVNLIGYTTGLMYGGKALSSATGVGNIGITGKSGKTLLGGSFSGGNIGVTIAGKTLNLPTLALVGGASSGLQEANSKENVNEAERWTKAISSSLIEGTTEGLFGLLGVGGSDFSENIAKKVASKFSSRAGKMLAQIGVASAGESTEEFLSYVGNYLVNNHLVDKLGEADFRSKFDWGELGEQMALAFVSSALTQGGGSIVNTNNAIKSAEQQLGRKLTSQEKAQVTQSSIEGTLIEKIDKLKKQREEQGNIVNTVSDITNNQQQLAIKGNENGKNKTVKLPTVEDIVTQEQKNNAKETINQSLPVRTLNFIESARKHNIDFNSETIRSIDNLLNKRNINATFDANRFNDINTNAFWTIDDNGNRNVIFNPNANTNDLLQNVAIHELTHDLLSSKNSAETLNSKEILDFISTKEGYAEARNSLIEAYSKVYDPNSVEFQSIIDEEVVASVLGNKLGTQEFVNQLVYEKPTVAKRVLNWIENRINELKKLVGYTSEKTYWEDVKKRFEKAYKMSYNNATNQADTRYGYSKIGVYDKFTYDSLIETSNITRKDYAVVSKAVFKNNKKGFFDYDLSKNGRFLVYQRSNTDFKIINKLEEGKNLYDIDRYTSSSSEGARFSINNERSDTTYTSNVRYTNESGRNEKISNGQSQQEINSKSNNIESKSITTSELDNSSFSYDNQGRTLTKEQQEYFKDSKVRDENGNLKVLYHGTPNDFTKFSYDFIGTNGTALGKGFYLAENITSARAYASNITEDGEIKNGNVMEVYANITKPMSLKELSITKTEYKKFVKAVDKATKGQFLSDYGEVDYEGYNTVLNRALENYEYNDNDVDLVHDVLNTAGLDWEEGFRLLKDTLGYDGIINEVVFKDYQGNDIHDSVYVSLLPEQIKNVDNTNPTSNDDIRYSQKSNLWSDFVNKNFKSDGTGQTLQQVKLPTKKDISSVENNTSESKVLNPLEISKLKPQDANTTPILPIIKVSSGKGESKFASNIENKVNMLSEESKNIILSDHDVRYYREVTNKESLEKAFKRLNDGGQSEVMRWLNNENGYDDVDVAEGWILLKQYQDSIATETDLIRKDQLNRSMVQVTKKLRNIATKTGQTEQAFNILNRLTPEGMVYYAQSELSESFEIMSKNKTKEWIEANRDKFDITPEETQFIMKTMQEVQQMEDGYDKRVKLAEIQKVMTDKLPPERGAGIKAWMRISMLFNPKTLITRNPIGNLAIVPVNAVSDLFASIVDKQIAKQTGIRTTGTINVKNYFKGFKDGAYQSYNDFKKGINTRNIQGNRFELTEGKSFNDNTNIGKALNRVDSLLSFLLDAGDRGFYEGSFTNSINNQMILNNMTEVTQDMIDIATSEGLSRTWQDNNNYTKFVLQTRKGINKLVHIGEYGLGDVLIPFAKTPANLTKAIVDYSPLGLVKAINEGVNLKRSLANGQFTPKLQHQFVQDLGKATAGIMLYILGYALAKVGAISGESDDDKDTRDFIKNTLGVSSYSIKIGNKSFTYDWAQPISAPLSIMANYVNKTKQNPEASRLENLISSLDVAGNILLEQSFMESINTVLSNNDGIATGIQEAILELPSRAIPTLMKQIVDLTDSTQRQSFEYDQPLQTAINKIKAKIPGLSKTLSPSVDSMGREIQKYGGKNNIFNVFLNPANVNTENISKSAKEIYNLYKETGETTIMPRVAPYYINKNGNKIVLDSKQRAEYQKISGKVIEQNIQNLIGDSNYDNLSNDEKVNVISNIVNFSYNVAQSQILGTPISDTYKKAYNYSLVGNVSDYYLYKSQKFESDYYENGNVVTNSKKMKIIKYINGLNLSIPEKAILIKMEYNNYSSYNNQIINYINKMEYSKFEKAFLLKSFGFDNYDKYLINQINSQNMSIEEKTKVLEHLGFTIRNGRVYS